MQLYLLDGARLRELREEAGLSQEELSSMVGQRKGWIRELEQQSRVHVLDMSSFPDPPSPPTTPEAQRLDVVRLKSLREEAEISQSDLDEAAELEPGSVAQAEDSGEEVYASVETIWKLAMALDVSPTVLLKQ